MEAMNKIRVG